MVQKDDGKKPQPPSPRNEPDKFFEDAVISAYDYLLRTVQLAGRNKELLLMQSVQGRAMAGNWDSEFIASQDKLYYYPNTTIEDVIVTLGLNLGDTQVSRQMIINDIKDYVRNVFSFYENEKPGNVQQQARLLKLVDSSRSPLAGIDYLGGGIVANPLDVLRGIVIAGRMDNHIWRQRTSNEYGIPIHRGICVPVHLSTAKKQGVTLQDLADLAIKPKLTLEEAIDQGIVSKREREPSRNGYVSGFVELTSGQGISDDAAFISSILEFNEDTGKGVLLGDAIDTWDKCAPHVYYGGQDEALADMIEKRHKKLFGRPLCTKREITRIIYLSAINGEHFPSCSQRRFMEIDPNTGLCAIDSHLAFINSLIHGGPMPPSMKIGYSQVRNLEFYEKFRKRYDELLAAMR